MWDPGLTTAPPEICPASGSSPEVPNSVESLRSCPASGGVNLSGTSPVRVRLRSNARYLGKQDVDVQQWNTLRLLIRSPPAIHDEKGWEYIPPGFKYSCRRM